MKKIVKWVSISVAGLLVLAVAFTAVFIAIPFARTMRNLSEKKDEAFTPRPSRCTTFPIEGGRLEITFTHPSARREKPP